MNTIGVDSIDDAIERTDTAGGTIFVAKHAVPGFGWRAYFTDPQGAMAGVHQMDPSAA